MMKSLLDAGFLVEIQSMKLIRRIYTTIKMLTVVITFAAVSVIVPLVVRNFVRRRKMYTRLTMFFCNLCWRVMNVQLSVKNRPPIGEKNFLLVSNHTSFVDIFIVASQFPALFITSVDMRETPGLGKLTEMGGCLYVERRNRFNIHQEILVIRDALLQGLNVVLFPEAAATSGEKIYPFKKTLMMAAAGTGIEILPAVINYRKINGEPMSDKWRDSIFWYGSTPFYKMAWKAFGLKAIEVEIEFLTPVVYHNDGDRREVAAQAQHMIEAKYVAIPFPLQ